MNTIDPQKVEDEKEEEKIVPLRLLTGGKDTKDPNWLKGLDVGTVFLTRPKKDNYGTINLTEGLACLEIIAKTDKAARLHDSLNNNDFMVDMQRFSNRMDLFEIVGKVNQEE